MSSLVIDEVTDTGTVLRLRCTPAAAASARPAATVRRRCGLLLVT